MEKEYTHGELTVFWKQALCQHSGNCVRGLPTVFNVKARPWINAQRDSAEKVIEQINKCPSGALSYHMKSEQKNTRSTGGATIKIMSHGPFRVTGDFTLTDEDGNPLEKMEKVALCRCGGSSNKPFCDGTHKTNGFRGDA